VIAFHAFRDPPERNAMQGVLYVPTPRRGNGTNTNPGGERGRDWRLCSGTKGTSNGGCPPLATEEPDKCLPAPMPTRQPS
jgi:hypothetical protein